MPIETVCTGCGRTLRVADEHAGRRARCPQCQTIYEVPPPGAPSAEDSDRARSPESSPPGLAAAAGDDGPGWFLRTPEGQMFGPVARDRLDRWVREGRVTDDCHVRTADRGEWEAADRVYPALRRSHVSAAPREVAHRPALLAAGAPAGGASMPARGHLAGDRVFLRPHRGMLILSLGIIGCMFGAVGCPVFSVMAWVMGTADLNEMRVGRMDREGEGITFAGRALGMAFSILWVVGALAFVMFMLLAVAVKR
jgi:hypothetical protein